MMPHFPAEGFRFMSADNPQWAERTGALTRIRHADRDQLRNTRQTSPNTEQ